MKQSAAATTAAAAIAFSLFSLEIVLFAPTPNQNHFTRCLLQTPATQSFGREIRRRFYYRHLSCCTSSCGGDFGKLFVVSISDKMFVSQLNLGDGLTKLCKIYS